MNYKLNWVLSNVLIIANLINYMKQIIIDCISVSLNYPKTDSTQNICKLGNSQAQIKYLVVPPYRPSKSETPYISFNCSQQDVCKQLDL